MTPIFVSRLKHYLRKQASFLANHSIALLLVMQCAPVVSMANLSPNTPINHFFNANLLKPGESQISMTGNAIVGVSDNLQLGAQLFLLNPKFQNISIKHRMLSSSSSQTSFSGHIFRVADQNYKLYTGLVGINRDLHLSSSSSVNIGIYDLFAIGQIKADSDLELAVHSTSLEFACDLIFGDHWGASTIAFFPIFTNIEVVSQVADVSADFPYFRGISSSEGYPAHALVTITKSNETYNWEIGTLWSNLSTSFYPYLNLFWRFS